MIHAFVKNNIGVILDVHSGAVHVADRLAVQMIRYLSPPLDVHIPEAVAKMFEEDHSAEEINEVYGELCALYREGLLFSEEQPVGRSLLANGSPVKALCLHVSHDCNLRCKYCFASTGDFGTGRKTMPAEVARAAIDFVIQKSGARKNIEIDFFGGEPLMAFDTVKDTVAYAKERGEKAGKHFRFTMTTNGLLLDEDKTEYINREMDNVVLSIDGRPEINDRMRKTVSGEGCHGIILPKLQNLAQVREGKKDYYVRGTFTAENLDFTEDILWMADNGFSQLSIEPVVSPDKAPWALKETHLGAISAEYDRLAEALIDRERQGRRVNFFHFMIDLSGGPCVIKRVRGCGAGFEYVAVTPEGDIYPCHQFVGNDAYKMGNVLEGTFDETLARHFSEINVYTRDGCSECWAKYFCSGGCSAANLTINGDIGVSYRMGCEMEKKRLECALYIKAVESTARERAIL